MENEAKTVFGSWVIGESIGSGTDGRVSYIYNQDGNGNRVTGVLKTIFFLENRSETKDYNKIGAVVKNSHSSLEEIVEAVANNIDHIMQIDDGKRFVKYEEYEVRKVKGGYVLYIRLEQMRSLENLLREFSLTESETIQIGLAICRSLVRTRKFSYVYPYLKPENILFTDNGNCKLADFGSFSYLEPSKASIAYKKSECFMAPEFITGGKTNTTCDTYALGLILYMLTNRGRLPFSETYPQPLTPAGLERSKHMRMNGEPLPKPELASDELFEVIKKACAFNVEDRFLHPGQMLEALKAIGTGRKNQEPKYDEVYSNTAAPSQPQKAAPSSGSVNEYLTSKGMPDQRNVVSAPPRSLSFDDIMSSIENGGVPPKAPVQPAPKPTRQAEVQPVQQAERPAQNPAPQKPKPKRQEEALPFDDEEDEDEPFFDEYEEEERTNLFDKIRIPSFKPRDYTGERGEEGGAGRKIGRFFVRDLPQSNDDRENSANIKKAGIILIAIVLVFVLLIASCSARAKNKNNGAAVSQQSTEQIEQQDTASQIANNGEGASENAESVENAEDGESAENAENVENAENTVSGESTENAENGESQIPND